MNIYLDVNGVFFKRGEIASNIEEFLKYITDNHNVYWLTTYCKGDADDTVNYLKLFLPKTVIPYIKKIKETNWNIYKTEAINFSEDFRWIDDSVEAHEILVLKDKGVYDNWIKVNLDNKDELLRIIKLI